MKHKWSEGNTFMDKIYRFCEVCNGVQSRDRVEDLDYINAPGFHLDMVGETEEGWVLDSTPEECPGVELTFDDVE